MLDGTTSYLDTTVDHLVEPWPSVKLCNGADWFRPPTLCFEKRKVQEQTLLMDEVKAAAAPGVKIQ